MDSGASIEPRRPGRSRLAAALILQCLPLLAATSCLVRGVQGEAAQQAWFLDVRWLVVASALSWGLGYLPLRRWVRAVAALVVGALGNGLAANATLGAWSGAPDGGGEASLRQASLLWAGVIVAAVLALVLDTWRLARRPLPASLRLGRRLPDPDSTMEVRSRSGSE
jgi:hypothetical protein